MIDSDLYKNSIKTVKVAVSIVLYKNKRGQILNLLQSLGLTKINIQIYLIDNSPTDTLRDLINEYPDLIYIHNPSNPGYGISHNIALAKSRLDNCVYHLILNPDIYFGADVIDPICCYMEDNPDVGLLMPKILNTDGSVQYLCKLLPTPINLIIRLFSRDNALNFDYECRSSNYNTIMRVPNLSGCFMFLRHSSLMTVGFFDERFFMYGEDIDLSRRIAAKFTTIFFPNVSVYHEHGAASYKSIKMFLVHLVNMFRYFNKWGWIFDFERTKLNNLTRSQW